MNAKIHKIVIFFIVIIAVGAVVFLKASKENKTDKINQLTQQSTVQQPAIKKNNQLPTVLYFGRFT